MGRVSKPATDPRDELIRMLLDGIKTVLVNQNILVREAILRMAMDEPGVSISTRRALIDGRVSNPAELDPRTPFTPETPVEAVNPWSPETTGYTLGGPPFVLPPTTSRKVE